MTNPYKNKISSGFTLVEIAVVLVIFALVVTGILRGQELINSAKARNIIDQKVGIQAAFIGFSNRYKAMAGDLTTAQASFIGNGVVASGATYGGNGVIDAAGNESSLVFQNLTATSLLSCSNCMNVTTAAQSTNANTAVNIFSQYLLFATSNAGTSSTAVPTSSQTTTVYWLDPNAANLPARNALTTGSKVTAAILQQVAIKADNGLPSAGLFRLGTTYMADSLTNCLNAAGTGWSTTASNCVGVWLF